MTQLAIFSQERSKTFKLVSSLISFFKISEASSLAPLGLLVQLRLDSIFVLALGQHTLFVSLQASIDLVLPAL